MTQQQDSSQIKVLYSERQWVPWYWWLIAGFLVALLTAQFAMNRAEIWLYVPAVLLSAAAVWILLSLSGTRLRVEEDSTGVRWLVAGEANLPHTVVSRALAVPSSAKRSAMGRQLDPAAYLLSHDWVPEMAMLVLDDPEDPTPYWLISTKDPDALLEAFVPDVTHARSAEQAGQ